MYRLRDVLKQGELVNRATIITHQGYGDLFSSNGLVNYYSENHEELTVLVLDEGRKAVVDAMYQGNPKIKCVVPKFHSIPNGKDSCLICMTNGADCCPRAGGSCRFIDYSELEGYKHIKVGCFKGEYKNWETLLRINNRVGLSFAHCFYAYEGLPVDLRIEKFKISRPAPFEGIVNYVAVHQDTSRGFSIDASKIRSDVNHYQIHGINTCLTDTIPLLENAQELHFIDSSYSVLIYLLSFHNEKIRKIPKFLHTYMRPANRDLLIYQNPTPENWTVF